MRMNFNALQRESHSFLFDPEQKTLNYVIVFVQLCSFFFVVYKEKKE